MNAHILIVHDDPSLATILSFVLADHGYRASVRADSASALSFLAAHRVDLVLLDLRPRAACRALGAAIRRADPALPILHHPVRGQHGGGVEGLEPMALLARIRAALRPGGQGDGTGRE